jgi:hypothetical protein
MTYGIKKSKDRFSIGKKRVLVLKFDTHYGLYDKKTNKRLDDISPMKSLKKVQSIDKTKADELIRTNKIR